jgi:hypothetical protein
VLCLVTLTTRENQFLVENGTWPFTLEVGREWWDICGGYLLAALGHYADLCNKDLSLKLKSLVIYYLFARSLYLLLGNLIGSGYVIMI